MTQNTGYSFLPIEHDNLIRFYHEQKNLLWRSEEIDFSSDIQNWNSMKKSQKKFVKFLLFFFAQSDGLINENLIDNFKREVPYKEAKFFYSVQEYIEVIHNETYSLMIDTLISDDKKKQKAFNAIQNYKSIKKIGDWIQKWMNPKKNYLERVVAFACVEGVLFSSSFAGVYAIKRQGNLIHGFCKANEWIARDEGIHTRFAIELYLTLVGDKNLDFEKLEIDRVHEIIRECVDITKNFTKTATGFGKKSILESDLPVSYEDLCGYTEVTADLLCEMLGYSKIYDTDNPLKWMKIIGLPNTSNFFETKVTEYSHPTLKNSGTFLITDDF